MKIAIDVSPIENKTKLAHRVRGTGFYIENLKRSLTKYYPQNNYLFFNEQKELTGNIDLIHYPYFEPFFLTLPFQKKYKTIVTVHDLTPFVFPEYFPPGVKGKLKWTIQKNLLKRVDAVITDSECSKKDIIKYTGIAGSKVHVVYLASGEDFMKMEDGKWKTENIRKKYNLPQKFALYVGDVTWNKNLPRLIEAIKRTKVPLVMVGRALVNNDYDRSNPWNQDLAKVQNLIRENGNIHCPGFIPTEDLVLLYNTATVFVMPSLYEGFGLPVLEAMSCGCPVVTTKGGSLPEVAGDAGFYVDPKNTESIASGIERVYKDNKLQKEMLNKGLIQAKRFSWKKTAEETMGVYKLLI